jgi:hypothetical protein
MSVKLCVISSLKGTIVRTNNKLESRNDLIFRHIADSSCTARKNRSQDVCFLTHTIREQINLKHVHRVQVDTFTHRASIQPPQI